MLLFSYILIDMSEYSYGYLQSSLKVMLGFKKKNFILALTVVVWNPKILQRNANIL